MDAITAYLIEQGPMGLIALGLGWAWIQERHRNDKLNDAFRNLVDQMFQAIKEQGRGN